MAGIRIEFDYEIYIFVGLALDAKIQEYSALISVERKRPYSEEGEARLKTLNYFLRGYRFAKKAITGLSVKTKKEDIAVQTEISE